jgi:hypothetical protein
MKTSTQIERCATCSTRVAVGPHTTRARYTGRALCDRCGVAPWTPTAGSGGSSAVRVMTDAELRALDEWLATRDPYGLRRSGVLATMTDADVRAYAGPELGDGTDVEWSRCHRCGQMKPAADMHEVGAVGKNGTSTRHQVCGTCWDALFAEPHTRSYDDEEELYDAEPSEARVLRVDDDGTEVRSAEPDGRARIGTAYGSRWWSPDSRPDAAPRLFAADMALT